MKYVMIFHANLNYAYLDPDKYEFVIRNSYELIFDTMSDATGVNLGDIMKANTYDAQVNKNINLNGANLNITSENVIKEEPKTTSIVNSELQDHVDALYTDDTINDEN